MIGDAFEFGHQRAQPLRARGCADSHARSRRRARMRSTSQRCCRRTRARRVARRARFAAAPQRFDAFVDVAETFLEPHHCFAVGGEAEVSGLDDSGVHRAHGDLVQRRRRPRSRNGYDGGVAGAAGSTRQRMAHGPSGRDRATAADPARVPVRDRTDRGCCARVVSPADGGGRSTGIGAPDTAASRPRSRCRAESSSARCTASGSAQCASSDQLRLLASSTASASQVEASTIARRSGPRPRPLPRVRHGLDETARVRHRLHPNRIAMV